MRKDQIIVLLLVVLLPLTGCIGGGSDAGEESNTEESGSTSSEENQSQDSTTIINHYHYNNTTIIYQSNNSTDDGASSSGINNYYNDSFYNSTYFDYHYSNYSNYTNLSHGATIIYAQGGSFNGLELTPFILNTSQGELIQIIEAQFHMVSTSTNSPIQITSDCNVTMHPSADETFLTEIGVNVLLPIYLPGSFSSCTHAWDISGTGQWSIVYTVTNVSY
jgi:hypothetical protein